MDQPQSFRTLMWPVAFGCFFRTGDAEYFHLAAPSTLDPLEAPVHD